MVFIAVIVKTTKSYRMNLKLTPFQYQALIGLMLGDLCAERGKITHNTRLSFDQGKIHAAYVYHLYELFSPLINMGIHTTNRLPDIRTGNIYVSLMFKTLAFPVLNVFREMFYFPSYGKGTKILPSDLADHFTAVSFAYWIMDDGTYAQGILKICTDNFTLDQVQFLCDMLFDKYGIVSHAQQRKANMYRLYIASREMDKVRTLVAPYLISSMRYKVGL